MDFARRSKGSLLVAVLLASGLWGQDAPPKGAKDGRPEAPIHRFFDVRDLICAIPDFPRKPGPVGLDWSRQKVTGEDLANLIKFCVDRDKWEETDGKSISFQNGLLLIRNDPTTLESVDRFLGLLRGTMSVQHLFEIRILAVPTSDPAGLPSCGVLAPKDLDALWRESERSRWVVGVLTAAAAEGQRVSSASGSLHPPRVEGSGVGVYTKAELYPIWAPERGAILELQLEVLRAPLKEGAPLRVGEIRSTFALPAGGGCVLAVGETEGTLYYALIRGRTVASGQRGRVLDFMPNASAPDHLALVAIEDIVPSVRDFIGLPAEPGSVDGVHPGDSQGPLLGVEQVVDLIKESTSKIGAWQGNHTIEKTPIIQLLIHNTPATLAAVNKALEGLWPLTMPPSLTVRLTAVDVDDATLGRLREAMGVAAFPAPFGRDDRGRILQSLSSGTTTEDVSVTCYPTQRAFVAAHSAPSAGSALSETKPRGPLLHTILDVRCFPLTGKKDCILELRADLGKPSGGAAGNPAEEEMGESWRMSATVPLGGGLVLGAHPSQGPARRWRVCLVGCSNEH
jgi:hypothetical protein